MDSKTTLKTLLASLRAEINKFLCFGIKYHNTEMFDNGVKCDGPLWGEIQRTDHYGVKCDGPLWGEMRQTDHCGVKSQKLVKCDGRTIVG